MNKLIILFVVVALICATGADDDEDKKEKKGKKGGKGGWGGGGGFKMDFKWKCRGKEIKIDDSKKASGGECAAKCKYDAMDVVKDGKIDLPAFDKWIEKTLPKEAQADAKTEIKTCVDEAKEGKTYFSGFGKCQFKSIMKVCKSDKESKGKDKDADEE